MARQRRITSSVRRVDGAVFGGLRPGDRLDPLVVELSTEANDRYWDGAGIDHPLRRAGALYPLLAANLTVLAFGRHCPDAMIQTRQHLVCHRRADAPARLRTDATVTDRWDRRGLPYIGVEAVVSIDGEGGGPLWTSTVAFTPATAVGGRR